MYQVLIKNLKGFKDYFINDERLLMAEPLYLLADHNKFTNHKEMNTPLYQNLCMIIKRAEELKYDFKYHSFGMFLNELNLQNFDFDTFQESGTDVNPDILDYQISLLHQFMYPAYYN